MRSITVTSKYPVSKIIINVCNHGLCFTLTLLLILTMTMTIGDSFYCKLTIYINRLWWNYIAKNYLQRFSQSFNPILFLRFERYTTSDGQTHYAVAGYTTVYQYYAYPVRMYFITSNLPWPFRMPHLLDFKF